MTHPRSVESALPRLAPRADESHKGDFGRALVVGGSRGMAGAAALAAIAALRSGAGLVRLAVPAGSLSIVAGFDPSYMTLALPEDEGGRIAGTAAAAIGEALESVTAWACGPGLGRSAELDALVPRLYRSSVAPAVFDADALNAMARSPDMLRQPGGPRVLTPHPGEFRRLAHFEGTPSREALEDAAADLAERTGVVVLLKGHRTLVTDGLRRFHNETGNPGMATGGSGDVLTGVITALLCQGLAPIDAARLGAHLHGLAGDLAANEVGQTSLIASDLLSFLPAAFQQY